eukprot:Lithocolla_globosa_v1_NODE_2564_length_1952_cov_44.540327.p1 type:complete len:325 gc:universal NODE_2564_length_1952_cov_44.540327:155-1129(+)
MPAFLDGQKQHPTQDANDSRLVTKVRWVVEAINARVKKCKGLDGILSNNYSPADLKCDVRIVLAACNAFRPPLKTDQPGDYETALTMLERSQLSNELEEQVKEADSDLASGKTTKWNEEPHWLDLLDEEAVPDFPSYTLEEFQQETLGGFQVKTGRSYSFEHCQKHDDEEGNYDVFYHTLETRLIRVKIQSRHINGKKYHCWLRYDEQKVQNWYCKCKPGARTVGMCSHLASVIWYLGYARGLKRIPGRKCRQGMLDASEFKKPPPKKKKNNKGNKRGDKIQEEKEEEEEEGEEDGNIESDDDLGQIAKRRKQKQLNRSRDNGD